MHELVIIDQNQIAIVDQDAIAIGDLYRQARSSLADSARCSIEAGCRLIAKKDSLSHGEWLPWLEAHAEELGFDTRRTAARLMEAASKWVASVPFDAHHQPPDLGP